MTLYTYSEYVDSGLTEKDKITVGLKIRVECCVGVVVRCGYSWVLWGVVSIVGCCGVLWSVVGFCGVLWGIVGYCGLLWGVVVGCCRVLWCVMGCCGYCRCFGVL